MARTNAQTLREIAAKESRARPGDHVGREFISDFSGQNPIDYPHGPSMIGPPQSGKKTTYPDNPRQSRNVCRGISSV
jgi:hypothetical protein